jgi:hypothetical protein
MTRAGNMGSGGFTDSTNQRARFGQDGRIWHRRSKFGAQFGEAGGGRHRDVGGSMGAADIKGVGEVDQLGAEDAESGV